MPRASAVERLRAGLARFQVEGVAPGPVDAFYPFVGLTLKADALNLDGGGSTTMVINGQVVNRPSDPAGLRAVGDAILVTPLTTE